LPLANLRLTYDSSSDTAYLHLDDEHRQVGENRVCEEMGEPVATILDLDASGRVIGIEFFNATQRLPARLLAESEMKDPRAPDQR
jgi:uncharacterized protein YuzE